MFKVSYVATVDGLKEARQIMDRIYQENPKHWPNGLTPEHFDGGVYLVREKQSNAAVGFAGWQERNEFKKFSRSSDPQLDRSSRMFGMDAIKVGYYSIGVLPEYRRNGFAKEALQKLISQKSAGVDKVRAMIMATNKPSLALADRLGVEKQVKAAGLRDLLRPAINRVFRSPMPEGILGGRIRNLARKGGVHMIGPEDAMVSQNLGNLNILGQGINRNPYATMHEVLGQFKQYPSWHTDEEILNKAKGVFYSPISGIEGSVSGAGREIVPTTMNPWNGNKLQEAQAFKGYIPETRSVRNFRGSHASRLANMKKSLGDQLIFKPVSGYGSKPKALATETSSSQRLTAALSGKDPMLVQSRKDLQELPAWQQWTDNLLAKKIPGLESFNRGTRELRVHAMNGKVVPYGSMERGSVTGSLNFLLPFRTSRMRNAESLVQEALDKLPPKFKANAAFGFDVGFDRVGRPFIIEANPTDKLGASAM